MPWFFAGTLSPEATAHLKYLFIISYLLYVACVCISDCRNAYVSRACASNNFHCWLFVFAKPHKLAPPQNTIPSNKTAVICNCAAQSGMWHLQCGSSRKGSHSARDLCRRSNLSMSLCLSSVLTSRNFHLEPMVFSHHGNQKSKYAPGLT